MQSEHQENDSFLFFSNKQTALLICFVDGLTGQAGLETCGLCVRLATLSRSHPYVECCVLFLLVYMKNELQTATFCNLKNVMHHFFVHFLCNRCGWPVWYFRFTSPTARLYCIIHFGFEILGSLTVHVCIILSWKMEANNTSVFLLQLIPTIPLHSAVTDSPFAGFFVFTTCVTYSPFRQCSCNNDHLSLSRIKNCNNCLSTQCSLGWKGALQGWQCLQAL